MRIKIGLACIISGALLLCGAVLLVMHNQVEARRAEQSTIQMLPLIQEQIPEEPPQEVLNQLLTPQAFLEPEQLEMTEVMIDGFAYIGYLSIPSLNLDLPVMADWDYDRLQIAPCRFTGSLRTDDLVLMAHNYDKHFGRLANLAEGESLFFTDMDGIVTAYEVISRDILAPTAVEEVTSGDFDLTLFTCTYGGKSRVTVYCDRVA